MSDKKSELKSLITRKTNKTSNTINKNINISTELQSLLGTYNISSRMNLSSNEEQLKKIQNESAKSVSRKLQSRKGILISNVSHKDQVSKSIDWRQSTFESDRYYYGEFTLFFFCIIHLITGIIYVYLHYYIIV